MMYHKIYFLIDLPFSDHARVVTVVEHIVILRSLYHVNDYHVCKQHRGLILGGICIDNFTTAAQVF